MEGRKPMTRNTDWHEGLSPDDLPGDLQIIAQECGMDVAVSLAEKLGGMKLYIPQPNVVTLERKKQFIRENYTTLSVREFILATGLSEATVRAIIKKAEQDARQTSLL